MGYPLKVYKVMGKASRKKIYIGILFVVGIMPFELNGFYNPHLIKNPVLFWSIDVFTYVIMPLCIYLAGIRKKLYTNKELGFHFDIHGREKATPFFIGLILLPFIFYYGFFLFNYIGAYLLEGVAGKLTFDYSQAVSGGIAIRIINVIYLAISAGLVEEFYYRGMFKLLFKPGRFNVILYVLLSAVIFSSVHWEGGNVKLFTTFLFGLVAACAYLWVKNLWPLVFAHFVADFLLFY